jgi:hypothetical protein
MTLSANANWADRATKAILLTVFLWAGCFFPKAYRSSCFLTPSESDASRKIGIPGAAGHGSVCRSR